MEYNIMDENEMNKLISVSENRKIREVIDMLTIVPMINKKEYINLMLWAEKVSDRLEKDANDWINRV